MVSPQATHDSNSSTDWTRESDESVRITAEIRRQVLVEHYTEKRRHQLAVVESERTDRKSNPDKAALYSMPDMRVSNAIAVLQDISSSLAAFSGDENRDFAAVTR